MGLVSARRPLSGTAVFFSSKFLQYPHHAHRIQGTVFEQVILFGSNGIRIGISVEAEINKAGGAAFLDLEVLVGELWDKGRQDAFDGIRTLQFRGVKVLAPEWGHKIDDSFDKAGDFNLKIRQIPGNLIKAGSFKSLVPGEDAAFLSNIFYQTADERNPGIIGRGTQEFIMLRLFPRSFDHIK